MANEDREAAGRPRSNPDEPDREAWEKRHEFDQRGPLASNSSGFPDRSSRGRHEGAELRSSGFARPSGGSYPDYDPGERQGYGDWGRGNRGRLRSMWESGMRRFAQYYGRDEPYDRRGEGFRGRGPRGYRRSAERIREDVCDLLTEDPELDASDIEVDVTEGEVTLSGYVDSRWAKRRAEDCVDDVIGVDHVQNNLRVKPEGG